MKEKQLEKRLLLPCHFIGLGVAKPYPKLEPEIKEIENWTVQVADRR